MASLQSLTINDTGYLRLPSGTTAQRPGSPTAGYMRYNSDIGDLEVFDGTAWANVKGFVFDPEADLTLTRTESEGAVASFSSTERAQNAVFACELSFGTSAPGTVGAAIFDMGANAIGSIVALGGSNYGPGDLVISAGDGATPPDSTINALLVIDSNNVPYDGKVHTLVWEFRVNPGRVRCWIDGVFYGEGNTSGGGALESSDWAGGASGGFGTIAGTAPPISACAQSPDSDYDLTGGRTINSTLRYYQNQLVTTF